MGSNLGGAPNRTAYIDHIAERPISLTRSNTHRFDPRLYMYNFNATNTAKLRKLVRDARTGIVRMGFFGDSITAGFSVTGTHYLNGFAGLARDALTDWLGWGGTGPVHLVTNEIANDPRVVFTGAWTANSNTGDGAYGTGTYQATGAGNKIAFTPTKPVDSFTVYYVLNTGNGTFAVDVDGGTATNVASNAGAAAIGSQVITAGIAGTHTLNITAPASGNAQIFAVEGTLGTTGLRCATIACPGTEVSAFFKHPLATASDYAAGSIYCISRTATPQWAWLMWGANEMNHQTDPATFKANMLLAINELKVQGAGVGLLITPTDIPAYANRDRYRQVFYQLADEQNLPVIDFFNAFGPYTTSVTAGLLYGDDIHMADNGHILAGEIVVAAVRATTNMAAPAVSPFSVPTEGDLLLYNAALGKPRGQSHHRALTSGECVLDRDNAIATVAAVASGVMPLTYFTAVKQESISQIVVTTVGAAAATPTLCRVGVYELDATGAGKLVASNANDTTLFATANTDYTITLSAAFTKKAGVRYAIGILVVSGAAMPTFLGVNAVVTGQSLAYAIAPRLAGLLSSQSDLPTTIAAGPSASGRRYQSRLLP